MPTKIAPMAVDLSHHNMNGATPDFARVKAAGIVGVIHKADEGVVMSDRTYDNRRSAALAAGLLWGAYHFNSGAPVADQVRHFFAAAKPDARTLMALDFENAPSQMSFAQMIQFLKIADGILKRPLWLYAGNRIKETVQGASASDRAFLAAHPLWLCQYGPAPRLLDSGGRALPWARASLWQFTDGAVGPPPHHVDGITGTGIDINSYDGTPAALEAEWIAAPLAADAPVA